MHRQRILLAAVVILPALLCVEAVRGEGLVCEDGCTACDGPCVEWYVSAEALYLKRDAARRQAVSADVDIMTPSIDVLMTTDDARFGYEPGMRLTLGRQDGPHAVEVSYFGLHDFSAEAQVTAADAPHGYLRSPLAGFLYPGFMPVFDTASLHSIRYLSNLHNVEINYRRSLRDDSCVSASLLVGVRYMKIHEDFLFRAYDPDYLGGGPGTGTYTVLTDNDLIGGQVGVDATLHCTERLGLGARGRAALMGNTALKKTTLELGSPLFYDYFQTAKAGGCLASVVEIGLFATFQCTPRLLLRGGYDVLLVSGLALAPEQLAFGDDPGAADSINVLGNCVFHGPSFGLTYTW